jgi:outer membrane protein TolC
MILANALTNRPDVKAADLQVEAARINTTLAEDNIRPSLALVGKVGYGGTDEGYGDAVDAAFDDTETEWQVGLNFSVPLENSAAQGTLVQAMATHNKARTNAQLLRLQVKKAVRTTVRDVRLAIKAMEATRKTSLATLKRLEAEQAKFEAGRSTTLDVLIAQDAYSQALSQENRTNIVYVQSLAEIDRIQGLVTLSSAH